MTPAKFRLMVWQYYREQGRHDLPWRKTDDMYRILVSEVMLQQTQVDRVIPIYKKFITEFPTAKKLAMAPLSVVLKQWQGLGYNRRAKMLHQAAKVLSEISRFEKLGQKSDLAGLVPELEKLPGVGPYTSRAVATFAFNQDVILVETNIRTVIIHHFFSGKEKVSDAEIEKVLIAMLPKGKSRQWYSALMDYGAHLKRSGLSQNVRSKKQVKQPKFIGSLREARGAILRKLTHGSLTQNKLIKLLGALRQEQMQRALSDLCAEGLVQKEKSLYSLAE